MRVNNLVLFLWAVGADRCACVWIGLVFHCCNQNLKSRDVRFVLGAVRLCLVLSDSCMVLQLCMCSAVATLLPDPKCVEVSKSILHRGADVCPNQECPNQDLNVKERRDRANAMVTYKHARMQVSTNPGPLAPFLFPFRSSVSTRTHSERNTPRPTVQRADRNASRIRCM